MAVLLPDATCVWSPHYNYAIDRIESVQRKFTKRLKGCKDMEYPARLSHLHLHSLERRRLTATKARRNMSSSMNTNSYCTDVTHDVVNGITGTT